MDDFNEYASNDTGNSNSNDKNGGLFKLVQQIAAKYDGSNQNELLKAVFKEAEKGKKAGTLTNADLDNFAKMLSPFLDDKKRSIMAKIVDELKKI